MESFAPYVETYPVQWDIMYLHLALDCDFKILKAYSKAVYSRKEEKNIEKLTIRLNIPSAFKLGIAYVHLKNNQIHRTEGPAVVFEDGSYIWCLQGKVSRTNGPALVFQKQYMEWRVDGKPHRVDGPAKLAATLILKEWRIKGELHRVDGPAIEMDHTLEQLRKDKHFPRLPYWKVEFFSNGLPHRDHPLAAKIVGRPRHVFAEFWNNGQQTKRIKVSEYSELEPYL